MAFVDHDNLASVTLHSVLFFLLMLATCDESHATTTTRFCTAIAPDALFRCAHTPHRRTLRRDHAHISTDAEQNRGSAARDEPSAKDVTQISYWDTVAAFFLTQEILIGIQHSIWRRRVINSFVTAAIPMSRIPTEW